jgi:prolyl oligopeptidase
MTKTAPIILLAVLVGLGVVGAQGPTVPPTRQDNVRETIHGVEIVDPYRWLENQDAPETRAWIEAQNAYAHRLLDPLPARALIEKRLTALERVDRSLAPTERGGRYFFFRRRADQDLWVLYVRTGLHGADEVLLDPNALSADHTVDIALEDVSHDGSRVVYALRKGGEDETELHVRDVGTRRDLPDVLPRALYRGVSLKQDGSGFYYALQRRDTGTRIRYHALGTDSARDVEVFGNGFGPDVWVSAEVSENGHYLLLSAAHGWTRSEIFIQNLADGGPVTPVVTDVDAHFYCRFAGDRLVMQTDWQAPTNRILVVDPKDPGREQWKEIVPAASDAIEEYSLAGGRVFVRYLHDVTSRIAVFTIDGAAAGQVSLPGPGTASAPRGRWDSDEAFFDFSSYVTPRSTYRYDVATGKTATWSRDEVPFESDRFEMRQVWYPSKDGTKIPMFLVHRKGLVPNGTLPTLLYGYGGFNVSLTPGFSSRAAWWVEQGGVYAVANLRGGGEFGEAWHRAGMLDKKQNVFDDFIAAAEWLIANGYTSTSRLAIAGGSNGGLLVGAALTQRPDLFRAVLCEFPDLDMVGYYRFPNNNPPALLEYGNAADPEQFKYLYAYSPYQHVRRGTRYPAVLLRTGDADTRVPPLQARKMTARLQWATASDRPIVLLYDTSAGHSGGQPLSRRIEDMSRELAFLAWQLNWGRD